MANPIDLNLPADTWVKAATNVTAGTVKKKSNKPNIYTEVYRVTGGDAPTSVLEGVPIFLGTLAEPIESTDPVDVYVMAVGKDGKVRVDLP
jgi:hypothetical protein